MERVFGVSKGINWKEIHKKMVKDLLDKKIAEFNYKLLLDKLPNGKRLKKWKKVENDYCIYCKMPEGTEHLLFSCVNVKKIWRQVSIAIKVNITWRRLVLGYQENSASCLNIERLLSLILYLVFKAWVIFRNENKRQRDLLEFIKTELIQRNKQQEYMKEKFIKFELLDRVIKKL